MRKDPNHGCPGVFVFARYSLIALLLRAALRVAYLCGHKAHTRFSTAFSLLQPR
jgi:hypothetical protein